MHAAGMAEDGVVYPPVFVVDGQAGYPLPPRPRSRGGRASQWALYLLVSLALFGMALEACFIYHLYTTTGAWSNVGRTDTSVQETYPCVKAREAIKAYSTPISRAGPPRSDGILLWNPEGDSFTHELEYKEGGLEVQKEGYYYVYSKVFFSEPRCSVFTHTVLRKTPRYPEKTLELMESKRFHCQVTRQHRELMNSYLGGVFHLSKGDTLLVRAKNHTLIARQHSYENFFGAYMI
ncbi:hypothetical protein AAFF_G00198880 [Aldrovandia affinis]|uniref:THD domain-containing protein n=1 Tax=Aldrovandia affinis TaxID=143900 RepID=A0AAD7RIT0_9TELE|nr:hypothetical protein AAFF_G00198880 [Aldrovandia affinis]